MAIRRHSKEQLPIVVIGAGLTGMAVAARLATRSVPVVVLESHRELGGCCGYFRRRGFAFDVGATTLVDYGRGGVGGQLLKEIGLEQSVLEHLPGYVGWIGDQRLVNHTDSGRWIAERRRFFGASPSNERFWSLIDRLAKEFWAASRRGARMPITNLSGLVAAARTMPPHQLPSLRFLRWTVEDALRWAGVTDPMLRAYASVVVQDTVHSDLARAPLINGALGLSIRGAGLARPRGGMMGFWRAFEQRTAVLGVAVRRSVRVTSALRRGAFGFRLETTAGPVDAAGVVSTIPIWNVADIGPPELREAIQPWCTRDGDSLGGALLLTMGVPVSEIEGETYTHHQFFPEPGKALGDGNNCFLSVSSAGDSECAPSGWRAVMLTTHTDLSDWEGLDEAAYAARKADMSERLLTAARRAFPSLGSAAQWQQLGTPRSYQRFTGRHRGSVGGMKLSLGNSNQRAVPHDVGVPGWWVCGDTTWPGIGTVACALASKHVADDVIQWLR